MADTQADLILKKLEQRANELDGLITRVRSPLVIKNGLKAAHRKLEDALEELEALLADGGGAPAKARGIQTAETERPSEVALEQFMTNVGQSLLGAQRALDHQSREDIRVRPDEMPTLYRIPKLSAEVRFAFDKIEEGGVNVFFYKKVNTAKEAHQQSVQFDVVAVPPSPDLLAELRGAAPGLELILDRAKRAEIFTSIDRARAPAGVLPATLAKSRGVLRDHRRNVVILAAGTGSYLLFHADRQGDDNLGIWHLESGAPPVLTDVYRFQVKSTFQDQQPLREFIAGLGERQAAFLGD